MKKVEERGYIHEAMANALEEKWILEKSLTAAVDLCKEYNAALVQIFDLVKGPMPEDLVELALLLGKVEYIAGKSVGGQEYRDALEEKRKVLEADMNDKGGEA